MIFLEDTNKKSDHKGWIEVICGSMFSGKTEELIRRLRRAELAKLKVEIFKPQIDTRYSEEEVVSHDATSIRYEYGILITLLRIYFKLGTLKDC